MNISIFQFFFQFSPPAAIVFHGRHQDQGDAAAAKPVPGLGDSGLPTAGAEQRLGAALEHWSLPRPHCCVCATGSKFNWYYIKNIILYQKKYIHFLPIYFLYRNI